MEGGQAAAAERVKALLKVIEKIPMFANLGAENARQILQLCEFRSVGSGETLCKLAEPSQEMFILLSGQLGVYDAEHQQLASIEPVAPVGEMGLITGQTRSATVRSAQKSTLLVIKKTAFDRLMRSNPEICIQVYRNVVQTLDRRLLASQAERQRGERHLGVLEKQLGDIEDQIEAIESGLAEK